MSINETQRTEYDAVSVDIRLTADGKPVLMADEKVDRMSVDGEGKSVSGKVSSFTLAQLKELYLRESNGGTDKKKTTCRIPELKEIYETAAGRTAVMLNVQENDFKTVYDYVKALGKLDETIFRINAKPKKIIELTKDLDGVNVTGNYQGNIIFLATSAVKKYFAANIYTIEMGSTNGNGVLTEVFYDDREKSSEPVLTVRLSKYFSANCMTPSLSKTLPSVLVLFSISLALEPAMTT